MEDFEKDFDNEKEKEKNFIRLFFDKRMIWEDRNCYIFLEEYEHRIAIELLKSLSKNQPCSQLKLFDDVKPKLKEFVNEVLNRHNGLPSSIKSSKKDKWAIRKKKGSNEYIIRTLITSIKTVLNYMCTYLIKRKVIWDKTGKRPNSYILHLTLNGKKLVEAIEKREEKVLQISTENISTLL